MSDAAQPRVVRKVKDKIDAVSKEVAENTMEIENGYFERFLIKRKHFSSASNIQNSNCRSFYSGSTAKTNPYGK